MPSEARQKKIMEKLNRAQKCSILGPQNLGSGGPGPLGPPWIRTWIKYLHQYLLESVRFQEHAPLQTNFFLNFMGFLEVSSVCAPLWKILQLHLLSSIRLEILIFNSWNLGGTNIMKLIPEIKKNRSCPPSQENPGSPTVTEDNSIQAGVPNM